MLPVFLLDADMHAPLHDVATSAHAGPDLSGKNVTGIMRKHRVTFACGVPTIFAGLLLHLEQSKEEMPPSLVRVNIGGSAMPISMLQAFDKAGVDAVHAWGRPPAA